MIAPPRLADDAHPDPASYRGGHVYVGAGPGTGKTTLLVERCRLLRAAGVPGAKILVLTFSRRAAQELRERLVATGFHPGELEVRTFHGFAARVIGGGVAPFRDGRLLDGFSRTLLLDAALEATPTPSLATVVRESDGFRREVSSLLEDLGRVATFPQRETASPRVLDLLAVLDRLRKERAAVGGRDLGDLVGSAVAELREPGSAADRWLADRYAHILIDEFQDTDRVQLELLAILAARGATLFAVGDEAQSIYRFRGAGYGIVGEAERRFAMRRFALTVSHRCPPDPCALASATPIPDLAPLTSAHPSGEPVRVVRLRRPDDEATFLADAIEAALADDVPAHEIAVLLRAFRPLGPLLVAELRRRGVVVTSTGREELLADPRIGTLRVALDVLARPSDAERWLRLLAAAPLRYDPLALRFARDELDGLRLDASLPARLETLCSGGLLRGAVLGDAILEAAEAWERDDLGLVARRLARRLGLLAAVLRDEAPVAVRAAAARLRLVCDALRGAQHTARRLGIPASCNAIVERFDELLPALALDDAGLDPAAPGVRVLTVHAAKGLEFERVFIADAVNGRFPQAPRPSTLLDESDRDWLAGRGAQGPLISGASLAEEASLWYVGVTRSTSMLTITFASEGLDGASQAPSRFIPAERLPSGTLAVERESLLSRALRSGDATVRERVLASGELADAPALAAYARSGEAAFAPLDPRPLALARNLAVGDVDTWLRCPRRLLYRRFFGLEGPESEALATGALLHRVLERFHTRWSDFSDGSVDVDGWTAQLLALREQLWEPNAFGTPLVATAAANAADIALRGYARALAKEVVARPFVVEQREVTVTVRVGRHELNGRVDRVDRAVDGMRTIVDYKKGAAKAESLESAMRDALELPKLAGTASSALTVQLPLYATVFDRVAAVAYVYLGGVHPVDRRDGAVVESTAIDEGTTRFTELLVAALQRELLDPLAARRLTTLPVAGSDDSCTFCPYARICPGPERR